MLEIREVTTYNDNAPFCGYGIWIVLAEENRRAHLIHPIYLTEMYLREYEYIKSVGGCLYPNNTTHSPFNKERFITRFKERISVMLQSKKPFPVNTVARVLSELEDISIEKALASIGQGTVDKETGEIISGLSVKANREYALKEGVNPDNFKGRQRALLCAFKEHGSASIYQITSLVEGKLKTKSSLGRVVTYFVNKLASQGILEIVA